jgi:hypothetical protein
MVYYKDANEKITRILAIWINSKYRSDNHGVWQLCYCTEQECKVFYNFASKVEYRKVLESQLIQVQG